MKFLLSRAGVALLLVLPLAAVAQPFNIDWYTVDGGGGTSTGGNYTLSGTIGQSDAGTATLGGGSYTLDGGFWPGLVVTVLGGGPTLFIQTTGGEVIVFWSPDSAGFTLEQTDNLSTSIWADAPDGNPVSIPASDVARFYRLKKP